MGWSSGWRAEDQYDNANYGSQPYHNANGAQSHHNANATGAHAWGSTDRWGWDHGDPWDPKGENRRAGAGTRGSDAGWRAREDTTITKIYRDWLEKRNLVECSAQVKEELRNWALEWVRNRYPKGPKHAPGDETPPDDETPCRSEWRDEEKPVGHEWCDDENAVIWIYGIACGRGITWQQFQMDAITELNRAYDNDKPSAQVKQKGKRDEKWLVDIKEMRMQRDHDGGTQERHKVRRVRLAKICGEQCIDTLDTLYLWQFASDWGWKSFPSNEQQRLLLAYTEGKTSIELGEEARSSQPTWEPRGYRVDITDRLSTKLDSTKKQRRVRLVEVSIL